MKSYRYGSILTVTVFSICYFVIVSNFIKSASASMQNTSKAIVTEETQSCLACHTKKSPAITASWHISKHAQAGIGCYECHQAKPEDMDHMDHYNNFIISVLVTPKDCSQCHDDEAKQFLNSNHAKAGEISHSLDNYLGEIVEGPGASISGCRQCHGSKIVVEKGGKLSAETWPNLGIGRINPDGTSGACSACNTRHNFSISQARTPETCGKCHLGPNLWFLCRGLGVKNSPQWQQGICSICPPEHL